MNNGINPTPPAIELNKSNSPTNVIPHFVSTAWLAEFDAAHVAKTRSTGAGQYRFKGVAGGRKYKVRVNKKGFRAESPAFEADKAGEEAVDLNVAVE